MWGLLKLYKENCSKLHGRTPRINLAHNVDTMPGEPTEPIMQGQRIIWSYSLLILWSMLKDILVKVYCMNVEVILGWLVGYLDVDWIGSSSDRRSTSSYYVLVRGNLISWKSKKSDVVARSIRVLALVTYDLIWIKQLIHDLIFT